MLKTKQFKTVFNGDTAYITQVKQQKIKKVWILNSEQTNLILYCECGEQR